MERVSRKRLATLTKKLAQLAKCKTGQVSIYFWPKRIRIAEISFVSENGMSGSSLMQCDVGSLAVLCAAERFLIEPYPEHLAEDLDRLEDAWKAQ